MIKKITSIDDLNLKEINKIADDAIKFSLNKKKIKKSKVKNIFNLFLEPSTRTTVSFELAAKKLGHNIININFDKSITFEVVLQQFSIMPLLSVEARCSNY